MNAHGQEVPEVEKRADHFNFTDHSPVRMLSMHEPVKSNLQSENKMNADGREVPEVEKRADHFNFTDHYPVLERSPHMNQ